VELDTGLINDPSSQAIQSIYFANYRPLSDAAETWVA
jgi:hypothetical protein